MLLIREHCNLATALHQQHLSHRTHDPIPLLACDFPQAYLTRLREIQHFQNNDNSVPNSQAALTLTHLFPSHPPTPSPRALPFTKYSVSNVRHESEFTAYTLHKPSAPFKPPLGRTTTPTSSTSVYTTVSIAESRKKRLTGQLRRRQRPRSMGSIHKTGGKNSLRNEATTGGGLIIVLEVVELAAFAVVLGGTGSTEYLVLGLGSGCTRYNR